MSIWANLFPKKPKQEENNFDDSTIVKIQNLSKSFGKMTAVSNLSLSFHKGDVVGLVGPDACGKTTLIRLILGLLKPNSGSVSIYNLDSYRNRLQINAHVGYMPQKFGLYEDLTVIENLNFYADLKNVPRDFDELLKMTNLWRFTNRRAGNLSGGMKQKLGLAAALLGNPAILVLDEPSVGVDPVSRRDLMQMVSSRSAKIDFVLWSTSYLDEAYVFNRSVVMNAGQVIFDGNPRELSPDKRGFEKEIIKILGGYKKEESLVAKNFVYDDTRVTHEYPVEADNLVKRYGNFYAVKNNSFRIRKGEIFGLLGPNGAGKSTSFKMMCGLAKPTSGQARIMGIDVAKKPTLARSYIGYMSQKFSLYEKITLRQNLEFFSGIYGLTGKKQQYAIDQMLDVFTFRDFVDVKSVELPLGYKQRLALSCALIHNPPILFLDEPTSGVDVITRNEFWNHITSLAKKGCTILITTHFMDEAENCDTVNLFYNGEIVAFGPPAKLKERTKTESLEDAFIKIIEDKGEVL